MGKRFYLKISCAYCNSKQKYDVYYAPTCNFETFECDNCGETNFITSGLTSKKLRDVTQEDVEEGFINNTMGMLSEKEIKLMCKQRFKQIKKLDR